MNPKHHSLRYDDFTTLLRYNDFTTLLRYDDITTLLRYDDFCIYVICVLFRIVHLQGHRRDPGNIQMDAVAYPLPLSTPSVPLPDSC